MGEGRNYMKKEPQIKFEVIGLTPEQKRFVLRGLESLLCSGAYTGQEEPKIQQLQTWIRTGKLKK